MTELTYRYVNCTGFSTMIWETKPDHVDEHPILILDADPADTISLQKEYVTVDVVDDIPFRVYRNVKLNNLPLPIDGTIYIVNKEVLDYINKHTSRTDFVTFGAKAHKLFDENGQIVYRQVDDPSEYTVKCVGYRSLTVGDVEDIEFQTLGAYGEIGV